MPGRASASAETMPAMAASAACRMNPSSASDFTSRADSTRPVPSTHRTSPSDSISLR
ncbi:hypothetical protein [Lentzea indica]|uniref:hypothetical protein n=1 Tax=Lentzea indica TaxID=2604800 RepID=UPI001CB6E38F|nr:hypothetical protein [Lentzea indica]